MSRTQLRASLHVAAAALCLSTLLCAAPSSHRAGAQNPPSSADQAVPYFPTDDVGRQVSLFTFLLPRIGEPSLLTADHDPDALIYRIEIFYAMPPRLLAVRLSLNLDGTAGIFGAEEYLGNQEVFHSPVHTVSATDTKKFLDLVDRANFWSMPMTVQPGGYYRDAGMWAFEGVLNGNYHVVFRESPDASQLTDIERSLVRGLAQLDEAGPPLKFQFNSAGSGLTKGGEFSFEKYKSQDDVIVEKRVESYEPAGETTIRMNALIHSAIQKKEQTPVQARDGGTTQNRWEIYTRNGPEKGFYFLVLWADGHNLYILQSSSERHVLAYEALAYPNE